MVKHDNYQLMMIMCSVLGINWLLCLPKAELNTKNSTRWQLEFLDFNSIVNVEKKVTRDTRSFFAYFNRNKNKISTGD